jgi:coproporphyrinogen III oxidase
MATSLIAVDLHIVQFVRDVAGGVLPSWQPIAERRRHQDFSDRERQWQLQRRGSYVCFNTLYDRGFRFGKQYDDLGICNILLQRGQHSPSCMSMLSMSNMLHRLQSCAF